MTCPRMSDLNLVTKSYPTKLEVIIDEEEVSWETCRGPLRRKLEKGKDREESDHGPVAFQQPVFCLVRGWR